jgi:hypothetical protein
MAERAPYPGAPRWVKVFGIIAVGMLLGLGLFKHVRGHGPGTHVRSGQGTVPEARP